MDKLIFSLFCFVFISFFLSGFVAAASQVVEVNFNTSSDSSYDAGIKEFSSILLRVNTDKEAVCKYSKTPGQNYSGMEGNFDSSIEKIHKKTFNGLGDGIYRIYVRCINSSSLVESSELGVVFRINSLVSANIILSKEPPLKSGRVDLTLLTSKEVFQMPSLSYSFDGVFYNEMPLFGSGNLWKGYLIVPTSAQLSVCSFKFKANDIEGRQGTEITSGGVFLIDTIKPRELLDISAVGYSGKIKVEWHSSEDTKEFKIYRSESHNPDYTNYYASSLSSPFYDSLVESGKVYYYRVSAIDEAGNEADLSKEVYAAALLGNNSSIEKGLSVIFLGIVDNLLFEINSVLSDTDKVNQGIALKSEVEREVFSALGLDKNINSAVSELSALKKEVERYKLQDLSKEELESKSNSVRLKLAMINKKVPESFYLDNQEKFSSSIEEDNVREALLQTNPEISERELGLKVENAMRLAKESSLVIDSSIYNIRVAYLDGAMGEFSLVIRKLSSSLENMENVSFFEIIPKEVAETASDIVINNLNYKVVKQDPILSFSSDTKQVSYFINKKIDLASLKEIGFSLVDSTTPKYSPSITAYLSLEQPNIGYMGLILGGIITALLLGYFIFLRGRRVSETILSLDPIFKEVEESIKLGNIEKARESYKKISDMYSKLSEEEKKLVFSKAENSKDMITLYLLQEGFNKFKIERDPNLLKQLEGFYEHLSEKNKSKLQLLMNQLREDFKNEK